MLLFGQDNGLPTYPDSPLNWFSIFLKRHGLNHKNVISSRIASQLCNISTFQSLLANRDPGATWSLQYPDHRGTVYSLPCQKMNKRATVVFSGLKKGEKIRPQSSVLATFPKNDENP
ncbi:hypothetical protein C7R91_24305 [Brevibacillus formosus]|nr:hypothetical protein C7R91_24305 [Brevibacillus formosus]